MVFSSFVFLFVFFPFVLLSYFLVKKRRYRNIILFSFSLLFYAWGEPIYVLLMLLSIAVNYELAIILNNSIHKKFYLITAIVFNIFIIGFFKYGYFIVDNLNALLSIHIPFFENIGLPIGISFYTFQILSYVIDVYRGIVPVQKSIINLGTYISLFPQLIAGPIVRYETIANELQYRQENLNEIIEGLKRFIIGLGKKVIIANQMALIADTIYNNISSYGTFMMWLAAFAYTFQIYFDFSGYSDMAIGLGRIFGFHFLENFNYPYIASSITDFWRRWHISLSSWFRDYIYIPLGGNRVVHWKWLRNIFVVWLLTGLWHGASWNYVIWGLYYGTILAIEKVFLQDKLKKWPSYLQHFYALFFIIIGWVIFRIENFSEMGTVFYKMFVYHKSDLIQNIVLSFDIFSSLPYMIFALIGCVPFFKTIKKKYSSSNLLYIIRTLSIFIIFIFSLALLFNSTYNPFIYFRF